MGEWLAYANMSVSFMHTLDWVWVYQGVRDLTAPMRLGLNPLKPELNPICYLLALLGVHHFIHVSRIRVKLLTLRWLMS